MRIPHSPVNKGRAVVAGVEYVIPVQLARVSHLETLSRAWEAHGTPKLETQ
ncbi:hypothetical protein [Caballeronia sp. SBC2]|uniref:hypothetical protein n=1 Tax=Caballeronia sp. SBC2 TaxID=2705547 RepID=UPI0013E1C1D4|nr:hypothetical protein [Caballeronia sp. SBC2]QIE29633.1 hypothetical protein SBC2_77090 [Caballeronia sp. SBC2]